MKNILKYSLLAVFSAAALLATACSNDDEYDTNQLGEGVNLGAIAPNPVMRGGVLTILGTALDQVTEVRFTGDVTVPSSDFVRVKTGAVDSLEVLVPLEGPEVGPVSIVSMDGRVIPSMVDLTFTEPIEISSVSPATVLSGDVITIKGEYLNDVQEVIFGGDAYVTEFVSQSRKELKVAVPATAVTGYVIVGDVNELSDKETIPNKIYSPSELTVGDPTVTVAAKATYKSGEIITVKGEHLDMIQTVNLSGAADVAFTVAEDAKSLSFNLPVTASDGNIELVSYAGKSFVAGEIETVTVTDLDIASTASDGRYKAGTEVEITGSDLDLVTAVDFVGASANFYMDGDKILATIPAAAQDGNVTVTLGSGKQAFTPEIEVVKPVLEAISTTEAVAGAEEAIVVTGADLDLVTTVTIGDSVQGLIPADFSLVDEGTLNVYLPREAYTGVLTLTADSGYSTVSETVTVTYDEAVSIVFDSPSFGLGRNISMTGKNLLQIESVYIKGKKVTSYATRTDNAMAFGIPENIGPGVYRLELVLISGDELTWPVPFEITAPYTETFIWEGYEDMGTWSIQPYYGSEDAFLNAGIAEGDIIRIYYTPLADWWQFQIFDGHWGALSLDELDGGQTVSADNTEAGAQYFAFEVTADLAAQLSQIQNWGGALLTQGEGVAITGISLIKFGAADVETVIWEGYEDMGSWSNQPYYGSEDAFLNAGMSVGDIIRIYYTPLDEWWQFQIFDGHWGALALDELDGGQTVSADNTESGAAYFAFEVTSALLSQLTDIQNWGGALLTQGENVAITKISLVQTASVGPVGTVIWEGYEDMGSWSNQPYYGEEDAFLNAGMAVGSVVRISYTPLDEWWQFQIFDGHWGALALDELDGGQTVSPDVVDPDAVYFEFKVTDAILSQLTDLQGWGGALLTQGENVAITEVRLFP